MHQLANPSSVKGTAPLCRKDSQGSQVSHDLLDNVLGLPLSQRDTCNHDEIA